MFTSPSVEQAYAQRHERYVTAMNRGTPDRIPMRFFFQEAAARHCGKTAQDVALDYNLAFDVTRAMAVDTRADAVMLNAIWSNYGVAKAAGWRYLYVPGVDVNMQSVLQFGEPANDGDCFLHIEEYDEFIDDPTAFIATKWFARNTLRMAAPGRPTTFAHNVSLMGGAMAYANYMNAFGPASHKLKYEAGVVSANSGMIKAPLDLLADKFRGYANLAVDTIERPEQVLRACEALMPHVLANALGAADPDKQVPITLWAHRGCVPFFSQQTFDTIFWPTLKPVLEAVIAQGRQVLFYAEGNWERHYDALLTLPEGGIIYHLDKGDPALAARTLKPKFALSGGVSYDVLARGTPDSVRAHLKELFAQVKDGGGYILDATALMLSDVQSQNVLAAAEYTMEHGVYSQSSAALPRGAVTSQTMPQGKRPPGVCRPWQEEQAGYRALSGDVAAVEAAYRAVDAGPYNYLWTTVLW